MVWLIWCFCIYGYYRALKEDKPINVEIGGNVE